jgi:hypothetical protein
MLPNGQRLLVKSCTKKEWLCEYLPGSTHRGEVVFTQAFLLRHAMLMTGPDY